MAIEEGAELRSERDVVQLTLLAAGQGDDVRADVALVQLQQDSDAAVVSSSGRTRSCVNRETKQAGTNRLRQLRLLVASVVVTDDPSGAFRCRVLAGVAE